MNYKDKVELHSQVIAVFHRVVSKTHASAKKKKEELTQEVAKLKQRHPSKKVLKTTRSLLWSSIETAITKKWVHLELVNEKAGG